jgi:hypothetical protein
MRLQQPQATNAHWSATTDELNSTSPNLVLGEGKNNENSSSSSESSMPLSPSSLPSIEENNIFITIGTEQKWVEGCADCGRDDAGIAVYVYYYQVRRGRHLV